MVSRLHAIIIGSVLLQVPLMAQERVRAQAGRLASREMAEPPVPSDPLELVTGDAQPVQDVNKRAEIINLLVNAHRNSNVRATLDRVFYSMPATGLPLRLLQVREAIFYNEPRVGPRATLRTATGNLNGLDLLCALVARDATTPAGTGGRQWEEEEYCVDTKAGTLITYSQAPGSYVVYDYSKELRFHGKAIANGFTIAQAGQTVVEAQTESVMNPADNPAAFQPAGLTQIGVGPLMSPAWRFQVNMPLPAGPAGTTAQTTTAQIVMLHGMQAPDGKLSDFELLASSDVSLNDPALAYASTWQGGSVGQEIETGATPQSHEVLMMIAYSNPQAPSPPE